MLKFKVTSPRPEQSVFNINLLRERRAQLLAAKVDAHPTTDGSTEKAMSRQGLSSSVPLAQPSKSTQPITYRSKEDELDALTKNLIDNMYNPPDKELYGYCGSCNQQVLGEKTGCSALDKIFHISCFICQTCNKQLHGDQFYSANNSTFCEPCYMSSLEKCTICSKIITDRILRATGKPYHPACFKCVECGKLLDGIPFTVDVTNQIHCIDDFHKKFAPRCSACNLPIMPEDGQEETVRIVALDRSFHVLCYKCERCGKHLGSKEEQQGCYPMDGHIYCLDCNTALVQELSK